MNGSIAENRFTLTKELFDEGMKRVAKENQGAFNRKLMLIIAAIWLLSAAATVFLNQSPFTLVFETIILILVLMWVTVYLPWHKRRKAYGQINDTERTISFYQTRMVVNSGGRESTFSYDEIIKILSSKNLLILLTEDNTGILIERNSFTIGSEAEILKYL